MSILRSISMPIFKIGEKANEELKTLKAYDVFYHGEDAPYEDHGTHGESALS